MLIVGFLAKNGLPHLTKWQKRGYKTALVHQYIHHAPAIDGLINVHRVRTSWLNTMLAHFELYRRFLSDTNGTHLLIASETCIPLHTRAKVEKQLMRGMSYAYNPWARDFVARHPHDRRQRGVSNKHYKAYFRYHEQWYIISREHVQLMMANDTEIKYAFLNCPADNEHFMATALTKLGRGHELQWAKVTFANWERDKSHPKSYHSEKHLPDEAKAFWFARKVLG